MLGTLKQRWNALNEWLKAFVLALILLFMLHVFVVRWVIVESTSMYATLRPGDLVLVQRWPVWTGLSRNDVVVFRDPLKDDVPMVRRPLLVKRIVGMPGDLVRVRDGETSVNGKHTEFVAEGTRAYLVRLRKLEFTDSRLRSLGLPEHMLQPGRTIVEVPLNEDLARSARALPYVVSVDLLGPATGSPRHIFPFSPRYAWNSDDYGPIAVPAKGDTLHITADNLPLYDRLISVYEGHSLSVDHKALLIDGQPLTTYVVEQNYYFVLGDRRHYSADSRYWGFVPEDHITGRAGLLLWGKGVTGASNSRDWAPL